MANTNSSRIWASRVSLLVSILVLLLKTAAYLLTKSTAIYSDALETIVNLVASLVAMFVVAYGAKPKDDDHPYGHGKFEYFSAAFEGGLILFAAALILVESYHSFYEKKALDIPAFGWVALIVASVLNFVTALYLGKIGRAENSDTLKASSVHLMSDVKTSAAVAVGLVLATWTKWEWVDSALAVMVALSLLWDGWKVVTGAFAGLTDQIDTESLEQLAAAIRKNLRPGVIQIHQVRVIRSGPFHHVDAHMVVPEYWDVLKAHELMDNFERDVTRDYSYQSEIALHVDPCKRMHCAHCDVLECEIRNQKFQSRYPFSEKEIVAGPIYGE